MCENCTPAEMQQVHDQSCAYLTAIVAAFSGPLSSNTPDDDAEFTAMLERLDTALQQVNNPVYCARLMTMLSLLNDLLAARGLLLTEKMETLKLLDDLTKEQSGNGEVPKDFETLMSTIAGGLH